MGGSRIVRRHQSGTAVAKGAITYEGLSGPVTVTALRPSEVPASLAARALHWPKIYLELGKYRLSGLVVITTASGYIMGNCGAPDLTTLGVTLTGTMMAALSANSLNQWYEVGRDSKMGRTLNRPLPSGRISPPHALAFGLSTGAFGSAMLASQVNPLAGSLAL